MHNTLPSRLFVRRLGPKTPNGRQSVTAHKRDGTRHSSLVARQVFQSQELRALALSSSSCLCSAVTCINPSAVACEVRCSAVRQGPSLLTHTRRTCNALVRFIHSLVSFIHSVGHSSRVCVFRGFERDALCLRDLVDSAMVLIIKERQTER